MSTPRRRIANPGFRPPAEYLRRPLRAPDGQVRPDLLGERAIGVARELLVRGEPLGALATVLRALEEIAPLPVAAQRARLHALASDAQRARQALIAELLSAGAAVVQSPEDLTAFTAHLRRAATLGHFEALLGGATAREKERAARARQVARHRRTRS